MPDETFTVTRRDGSELAVRVTVASRLESGAWSVEVTIDAWRAGVILVSHARTRRGAIGDVKRTLARQQRTLEAQIISGRLGK